jgi:hypothetical protein
MFLKLETVYVWKHANWRHVNHVVCVSELVPHFHRVVREGWRSIKCWNDHNHFENWILFQVISSLNLDFPLSCIISTHLACGSLALSSIYTHHWPNYIFQKKKMYIKKMLVQFINKLWVTNSMEQSPSYVES